MNKPTIIGQLSWPIPVDSWLNCRAQLGWTEALTSIRDEYDVVLMGSSDDGREFETVKDECRLIFAPERKHGELIRAFRPDVVFWNDYPPIYRNWIKDNPDSKHIMRMHGDYRRFTQHCDVFAKAWCVVVPMIADPVKLKALGVNCNVIRIPFGIDVPEMTGGKPWNDRSVEVACPASQPYKGTAIMESVFSILRRDGRKCECAAWRSRDNLRELLHDTKVFFAPSAHEGLSRVTTEAAVAGCRIVVSTESDSMVEQAGLQGGLAISTGLISDHIGSQWVHRRNPELIASDLISILSRPPAPRYDWSAWDISAEVESLRELFIQAIP